MSYEQDLYGRKTVFMLKPMPDVYLEDVSANLIASNDSDDLNEDLNQLSKQFQLYDFYDNFVDIFN